MSDCKHPGTVDHTCALCGEYLGHEIIDELESLLLEVINKAKPNSRLWSQDGKVYGGYTVPTKLYERIKRVISR